MRVDPVVAAVPFDLVLVLLVCVFVGCPGGRSGAEVGRGGSVGKCGREIGCVVDEGLGEKDGPACVASALLCPSKNPNYGSVGRTYSSW